MGVEIVLREVEWEQRRGSCGWWPNDWREAVDGEDTTYWRAHVLGVSCEILECSEAPHYWLILSGRHGRMETWRRKRYDKLSEAQKAFCDAVLSEVNQAAVARSFGMGT